MSLIDATMLARMPKMVSNMVFSCYSLRSSRSSVVIGYKLFLGK